MIAVEQVQTHHISRATITTYCRGAYHCRQTMRIEEARRRNGKICTDHLDGPIYWTGEGCPPPGWTEGAWLAECERRIAAR